MKTRKCMHCGETFTPPQTKQGNPMKYCSPSCRAIAYNQHKEKARKKYNQKNNKPNITLCEWCGKPFTTTHNKKYCSIPCRTEALREQNIRKVQRYRAKHGKSEKEQYFSNLGTSNLRQHRKKTFKDEQRLIQKEKRRLKI